MKKNKNGKRALERKKKFKPTAIDVIKEIEEADRKLKLYHIFSPTPDIYGEDYSKETLKRILKRKNDEIASVLRAHENIQKRKSKAVEEYNK